MTTSPGYSSSSNPAPSPWTTIVAAILPTPGQARWSLHTPHLLPPCLLRWRHKNPSRLRIHIVELIHGYNSVSPLDKSALLEIPASTWVGYHWPLSTIKNCIDLRIVPCLSSSVARQPWMGDKARGAWLPSRRWRWETKLTNGTHLVVGEKLHDPIVKEREIRLVLLRAGQGSFVFLQDASTLVPWRHGIPRTQKTLIFVKLIRFLLFGGKFVLCNILESG